MFSSKFIMTSELVMGSFTLAGVLILFLAYLYQTLRKDKKKLEGHYQQLINLAGDAILSINENQEIISFNKNAEKIFGYNSSEVIGKHLNLLIPDNYHKSHIEFVNDFAISPIHARSMAERSKVVGIRKNRSEFPAEVSISKIHFDQSIIFTAIVRDITNHLETESKIRKSLEEKEVLLKEIHHRVKNNLQIISSLLNLQSRKTRDPAAVEAISESQNRIRSIAMIHELLYQSQNLAEIDFGDYLRNLTNNLVSSLGKNKKISFTIETNKISLSVDTAVHCGLIINELVTNAIKHGFKNGQPGLIKIGLKKEANEKLALFVTDNGLGLPEGLDLLNTETLGIKLITSLTSQIKGNIEIDSKENQGTSVKIIFEN